LIAVLCIAGWIGLDTGRAHRSSSDQVTASAGPGAVGCHSADAKAQPRRPAPPRGLVAVIQPPVAAPDAGAGRVWEASAAAPVLVRGGDPGAPRGPPSSFVVS